MFTRRALQWFGFGAAVAILTLAAGNSGQVGLAQTDCTVTVQPGQSIQQAIDSAAEGAVICLDAGTFQENLELNRGLILRGADKEKSKITGKESGKPVIHIANTAQIQVVIEHLTIADALGNGSGISVGGKLKTTIQDSRLSGNGSSGLVVADSAEVLLKDSIVSDNKVVGLTAGDSARLTVQNSQITGNNEGISPSQKAQAVVKDSTVSENKTMGIVVRDAAQLTVQNSQISKNLGGIVVGDFGVASILNNTITDNITVGILAILPGNIVVCSGNTVSNNGTNYLGFGAQKCH